MKPEYRELQLYQLSRALDSFDAARAVARPPRGWLKAVREALGLTLEHVGRTARTPKQGIKNFEQSEANDRITLRNLRRVAEALNCDLVYAIVPKAGTLKELAERRTRNETRKRVLAVEHTMALENQAVGGVKELIDQETIRTRKKS